MRVRGPLDLARLLLQRRQRRPIIVCRSQALGDAEQQREFRAHIGQVLLHRSRPRLGRHWVPTHGCHNIVALPHRPTQRRMLSSMAQRLVPMTR
jgi:hypothetical protein